MDMSRLTEQKFIAFYGPVALASIFFGLGKLNADQWLSFSQILAITFMGINAGQALGEYAIKTKNEPAKDAAT